MSGNKALASSPALAQMEAAVGPARLRVSTISVWEVGMLEAKGRISLPLSCEEWVRRSLLAPGLSLASFTPEIALASTRLPGEFHGDPADRILVATARTLEATLVTKDQQIIHYGNKGYLTVLAV